jgi:hypothetical protein
VIILLFLPLFSDINLLGQWISEGAGFLVEAMLDATGNSERGGGLRNRGF